MLTSCCFSMCMYSRDCVSRGFLLHILRAPFLCASFDMPLCGHPLRWLFECILRGAVFCAPFEVPCDVHPSRCCVLCILRGALRCASFEVLCFVHPSRQRSLGFCFGKNVSPLPNELLPEGSLCRKVSSLLWNFDRLFVYHRGNARKFRILRKCLPLFLRVVAFGWFCSFCCVDRVIDAEGFGGKMSPPFLSSMFRSFRGYFSFGFLPKVFWFGSSWKSKPPFFAEGWSPLALFLHISWLYCRRSFGSDLFEGRSPLAFVLHLLCLLWGRFFGSDLFEGRSPLAFVWISMQSLRILYTLLTYCFV